MAVKFPLIMKDGEAVRDLAGLRAHFDVEKIVEYFLDGRLKRWLEDRYMEDEAAVVAQLDRDDPALTEKLCGIFDVPYSSENKVDMERLERRKERLARLREYTDDDDILADVDLVAFDQEDLADLYDQGAEKIILCAGSFVVPKSKRGLEYIRIGNAVVKGLEEEQNWKKTEKCFEREDTWTETVAIDTGIKIRSGEEKTYQNVRVDFKNTIECSGDLSFVDCEIITQDSKSRLLEPGESEHAISMDGGRLRFVNCKFSFMEIESGASFSRSRYRGSFITGERAEIVFDQCTFEGCQHLINCQSGSVTFERCTGKELVAPLVGYGSIDIQVLGSSMTAKVLPHIHGVPESPSLLELSLYSYAVRDGTVPLFLVRGAKCVISKSSFTGFISGVAGTLHGILVTDVLAVDMDKCTFTECGNVIDALGPVNMQDCEFVKCMKPLLHAVSCILDNCKFLDCYGPIPARALVCRSCQWKGGYVYLDGDITGKLLLENCTFEEMDRDTVEELYKLTKDEFQYFRFTSKSDVNHLFPGGWKGKRGLIADWSSGTVHACRFIRINTGNAWFAHVKKDVIIADDNIFENCPREVTFY